MKNQIDFQWDEEARVWIATSKEIPGLILEHENKDMLLKRVREAIPGLQALNEYVRNGASLGYSAQLAGLSKEDFIRYLGEHNISIFHYDNEDEFREEQNNA